MMKHILLFILIITFKLNAQTVLEFNKRFVECEDKWVAIGNAKDTSFPFGFIYIDSYAGLTIDYAGSFKIDADGKFIAKKIENAGVKYRLKPNNVKVAIIPETKFNELDIEAIPDWLHIYKGDTNSIARLYRWGYLYNGWNECAKALTYLERAHTINPRYKDLAVELSFSYNCLRQFEKAEFILEEEIKANPTNKYVCKEYIYSLSMNKKVDKAANYYESFIKTIPDKQYNSEMCYNILVSYYAKKDKENFNKWYQEFLQQPNDDKALFQSAETMSKEINK